MLLLCLTGIEWWRAGSYVHCHLQHCLTLLEDENASLASLNIRDNDQLLIEVRNKDLTWPEEMVSLTGQSGDKYRQGNTV